MNSTNDLTQREVAPVAYVGRYGIPIRGAAAFMSGVLAWWLISNSVQMGLEHMYSAEAPAESWSPFIWSEHWALRVVSGWLSTLGASLIASVIARRHGRVFSVVSALPTAVAWMFLALGGWGVNLPFIGSLENQMSIGNKLACTVLGLTMIPLSYPAGKVGESIGINHDQHFDSRRGTLLGVKWYHYLWIPILLHLVLSQTAWVAYYGFEWLKVMWKSGIGFGSFIPSIFSVAIGGSLYLTVVGLSRAYQILAGLEPTDTGRRRALGVFKYGVGYPALAMLLQMGIMLLHRGIESLVK